MEKTGPERMGFDRMSAKRDEADVGDFIQYVLARAS